VCYSFSRDCLSVNRYLIGLHCSVHSAYMSMVVKVTVIPNRPIQSVEELCYDWLIKLASLIYFFGCHC